MNRYDIDMVRGDTLSFEIQIDGDISTPTNIRMTARPAFSATSQLFQVSLNNGITRTDAGYLVRVAPSMTVNASPGSYNYDVEFTFGSDVYTPILGKLNITADMSR